MNSSTNYNDSIQYNKSFFLLLFLPPRNLRGDRRVTHERMHSKTKKWPESDQRIPEQIIRLRCFWGYNDL